MAEWRIIMKVIDIYKQYFSAECVYNGVERRGVSVWLTAESDSGNIRYEVGVSFFPHVDEEDFGISYDAAGQKELFSGKGRRSKKKDQTYLAEVKAAADELAAALGGVIHWDAPLIEARYE